MLVPEQSGNGQCLGRRRAERGAAGRRRRSVAGRSSSNPRRISCGARRASFPSSTPDPEWTIAVEGFDAGAERAEEALLTLADGRIGTSGAPLPATGRAAHSSSSRGVYDGEGLGDRAARGAALADSLARSVASSRSARPRPPDRVLIEESTARGRAVATVGSLLLAPRAPGRSALRRRGRVRSGRTAARPPSVGTHVASGTASTVERGCRCARPTAASPRPRTRHRGVARRRVASSGSPPTSRAPGRPRRMPRTRGRRRSPAEDAGSSGSSSSTARPGPSAGSTPTCGSRATPSSSARSRSPLPPHGVGRDRRERRRSAHAVSPGRGYRGHVFWDTDVFVLPFLAATQPAAARAMLEYRVRRLPGRPRRGARGTAAPGARFPWESARSGARRHAALAAIRRASASRSAPAQLEEHIVADVAWAAALLPRLDGDEEFARGPGPRAARRDGALLGLADPPRPRRARRTSTA